MLNHEFNHQDHSNTLVLLVNLGSPDAPTPGAVRRYLREFLSDRRVIELPRLIWLLALNLLLLPLRSGRVARMYAAVFTAEGSPLVRSTARIANLVARQTGYRAVVDHAMCYGKPSIAQQLERWRNKRLERIVVFPLYPQYAASTTAAVFDKITACLMQWRRVPDMRFITGYYDKKAYIEALAASVKAQRKPDHMLLFSFHGLPFATLQAGDPYYCHCHKTARLLAKRLKLDEHEWRMVFQSRFGKQRWLQPYIENTLRTLPKEGITKVQLVCPGFAVDCLETLQEIAVAHQRTFIEAGGTDYDYIPCLNDDAAHISLLAAEVNRQLDCYAAEDAARIEPDADSKRQQKLYANAITVLKQPD